MKAKKVIAMLLAATLSVTAFTGCAINKTATVATLDKEDIKLGLVNFMIRYQEAGYDDMYIQYMGEGYWDKTVSGNNTVLETWKKNAIEEAHELYTLKAHQSDYDVEVSDNEKKEIKNYFETEPYEIKEPYVEQTFPVSMPLFNLGFKEKADKPLNEKQLACTDILLSALASNTSILYRNLMDSNLINSSFSYELFEGPGYCSVIFGGESRAPKQAAEMIKQYISDIKKNGIDKEDFEIARKSVYGDSVSSLNSVSAISNSIIDYAMQGNEIFAYIDAVANAKLEDINARLAEMLDVDNCTLSVVKQPDEV
mgnify:CR=1 FL=1